MDTLNFGVELEVIGGGADVLSHLHDAGAVNDVYLHEYHCGKHGDCGDCDPWRDGPDWTAQEDCTADAEFISRVLTSHSNTADNALRTLADALVNGRAEHDDGVGLHVHVDARPFEGDDAALVRMWRMWLNYSHDVASLARGSYHGVRTGEYTNARPEDVLGHGANDETVSQFFTANHDDAYNMLGRTVLAGVRTSRWLSGGRAAGTFEFRIWNSTRSLWRIRLAAYVSVAMTLAVLNGHDAQPDDGLTLLDVIGDYLPDDVYMGIVRQLVAIAA